MPYVITDVCLHKVCCYSNDMSIESPKYKVLRDDGNIELRKYAPYITASVEITSDSHGTAASAGFRYLADYIFGNNTLTTKIAMTTPVISKESATSETIAMTAPVSTLKSGDKTYNISFTMPSKYTLETLPKPNNREVVITSTPAHKSLVIRFSGNTSEDKIEKMTEKLKSWAKLNKIKLTGEATVSRYNPPWTPGLFRRNEISYLTK